MMFAATILLACVHGCAGTPAHESTGEFIDDSVITTKVKTAFIDDKMVKARDIAVETRKGTVQLSGFVDTVMEKTRAEQVARTVGGVKAVNNGITVR